MSRKTRRAVREIARGQNNNNSEEVDQETATGASPSGTGDERANTVGEGVVVATTAGNNPPGSSAAGNQHRPTVEQGQGDQGVNAYGDRLALVLEKLANMHVQPPTPRDHFKPPEFHGRGDVELFVNQFEEVASANGWLAEARLIHLRASLKEEAKE